MHSAVEAFRGDRDRNRNERKHSVVTEELKTLRPEMFILAMLEIEAKQAALREALQHAGQGELPPEYVDKLHNVILRSYLSASGRALVRE